MKFVLAGLKGTYLRFTAGTSYLKKRGSMVTTAPLLHSNKQIRIAVSCFFFCQGLSFASWASRIPHIKSGLGLTDAGLGSILLMLPLGQLTAMPFSGRLVTRFGSKNVLRICAILYALCLTNVGLASAPWQLGLTLYFFGVVGNMCNISVNTQAILTEKQYNRPIMTTFHGVWSSAGFTGALIGLLMTSLNLSPYIHFWIVAAMVGIIVVFAQRYLHPAKPAYSEKKPFFSKPDMILVQLGIIGFCSMAAEGAMFDWSGVYFQQIVKAPPSLIVLGYASFMVMMATGRFLGDKVIQRYGRKLTMQVSGLLITSGLLLAVLLPHIVTATIGFLIVGLGVSSIVPTVYSSVGRVSKIPPGIALASVSSISFLGFLIGPPLIGYISQLANLRYSLGVIALMGLGISWMVGKLKNLK
ncbi:MAG: MFS transporter [Niabella sp.]